VSCVRSSACCGWRWVRISTFLAADHASPVSGACIAHCCCSQTTCHLLCSLLSTLLSLTHVAHSSHSLLSHPQVSEANIARAAAEARQLELERANSQLRLEVATSQATARSTMEEAARLLSE
jgi:hypothetical protein